MSKKSEETGKTEVTPSVAGTSNTAAPKRARKKRVTYNTIAKGTGASRDEQNGELHAMLSCTGNKKGILIPGLEFEDSVFGLAVKHPASQTAITNPTRKELAEFLLKLA